MNSSATFDGTESNTNQAASKKTVPRLATLPFTVDVPNIHHIFPFLNGFSHWLTRSILFLEIMFNSMPFCWDCTLTVMMRLLGTLMDVLFWVRNLPLQVLAWGARQHFRCGEWLMFGLVWMAASILPHQTPQQTQMRQLLLQESTHPHQYNNSHSTMETYSLWGETHKSIGIIVSQKKRGGVFDWTLILGMCCQDRMLNGAKWRITSTWFSGTCLLISSRLVGHMMK